MNIQTQTDIKEPIDVIKQSLGKEIYIKCRFNRELKGTLHAYDEHLNLLISDVQETINKTEQKKFGLIFIRGDLIIFIAPCLSI